MKSLTFNPEQVTMKAGRLLTGAATFIAGVAFVLTPLTSEAQTSYKYAVSKKVYMDIANAVKDNRRIPAYNFIPAPQMMHDNAYFDPSNTSINMGETIYDLCMEFGADSLNALAMVLGHELAHYFKDHDWGMNFGTSHFNSEIAEQIYDLNLTSERRAEMEAEADYFGGFFGYLAGYRSLDVGSEFFDHLYTKLEIPDETFGYPSRLDRMGIAIKAKGELEDLIAVYDAANYLMMLGRYEDASRCLSHIRTKFPSREILSNAGVCLSLEALNNFKPEELQFVYPFGIDTDTRLKNAGQKGMMEETPEEKRVRLLNEAIVLFNEAIKVDPAYAPAYVNLALAQALLGEPELAIANGGKGARLAKEQGMKIVEANGYIAKGIGAATSGDTDGAKAAFASAKDGSPIIAGINLDQVGKAGTYGYAKFNNDASGEIKSAVGESVGADELEPAMLEVVMEDAKTVHLKSESPTSPELRILSSEGEDYYAFALKCYAFPKATFNFVKTPEGYKGATGRGTKVGDTVTSLEAKYGKPRTIVSGTSNIFYIYESTPIIFLIDSNKKVISWVLYNKS